MHALPAVPCWPLACGTATRRCAPRFSRSAGRIGPAAAPGGCPTRQAHDRARYADSVVVAASRSPAPGLRCGSRAAPWAPQPRRGTSRPSGDSWPRSPGRRGSHRRENCRDRPRRRSSQARRRNARTTWSSRSRSRRLKFTPFLFLLHPSLGATPTASREAVREFKRSQLAAKQGLCQATTHLGEFDISPCSRIALIPMLSGD